MKKITILTLLIIVQASLLFAQKNPNGLHVDNNAPDFIAKDQSGKAIHLKTVLEKKSVVLVFYRGEWCPFCNKELKALEDSLSLISAKNAIVLAVSPEKPENIVRTVEKTKATYSILYDEGLTIMKKYDVAFTVDSLTIKKYKGYGIDIPAANGNVNGANLPVPAIYVINQKGKIVYRHFDPDYRKRASVKEIVSHL